MGWLAVSTQRGQTITGSRRTSWTSISKLAPPRPRTIAARSTVRSGPVEASGVLDRPPAGQVRAEPFALVAQARQVHHPVDPGGPGRPPEGAGVLEVAPGELALLAHGVDQVVGELDPVQGRGQGGLVVQVEAGAGPRRAAAVAVGRRVAGPDGVAPARQLGHEGAADEPAGPGDQDLHAGNLLPGPHPPHPGRAPEALDAGRARWQACRHGTLGRHRRAAASHGGAAGAAGGRGDPGASSWPPISGPPGRSAEELDRGGFRDPEWVERWDVAFADLYLDAVEAAQAGRRPPEPWAVAFGPATATGCRPCATSCSA
jgi:hypothetical protein